MKVLGIIPARYGSTRFPGKPLAKISGISLIERVCRQAARADELDGVVVATDDKRIFNSVRQGGFNAVMTAKSCASGTDRLAEVVKKSKARPGIVVNIQGDEPLIAPSLINALVRELKKDKTLVMASAACLIKNKNEINNPNIVKVVLDKAGYALYFSRSAVPYPRDAGYAKYYKHLGIYCYRSEFLLKYASWSRTALEKSESLEQLRALENGYKIKIVVSKTESYGVDVPGDIKIVEKRLANG